MEKTTLKVQGMTCAHCSVNISAFLKKQGLQNVLVNFSNGEVSFEQNDSTNIEKIVSGINNLGYRASIPEVHDHTHHGHHHEESGNSLNKRFYTCVVFTLPLLLHMLFPHSFLGNPILQLVLSLPVIYIGITYFGKSAWGSIKTGMPNMDVLIITGSLSAFIYSLAGLILYYDTPLIHNYLFFETAATIITLVLLGNLLEHNSIKRTTSAIEELERFRTVKARKINTDNSITEINFDEIKVGDILLVNTGDKIPSDGRIADGEGSVDESMISGESIPLDKNNGSEVTGGTIVVKGSFKMVCDKVGVDTLLSQIINLVKNAEANKPTIQTLGDKVSSIFVPAVMIISAITFIISFFIFDKAIQTSLMSAIAVLVVSCPCAMGLATPTAVVVGIGRAAQNGILIKGGITLEAFAGVKNIVFDKTGTLTTGEFKVKAIECFDADADFVKSIICKMEKHSSHPIAKSLTKELKGFESKSNVIFTRVNEEKGLGIIAFHGSDKYTIGSYSTVKLLTHDADHTIYLTKNNQVIATVDIEDEIRANAKEVIGFLKQSGIKPILLSGDNKKKCEEIAKELGIDTVYSEQLPQSKLEIINRLVKESSTAMVGDGINDSPALKAATVGISLGNSTQTAIESANIILLNNDLSSLIKAYEASKHTLLTIKQNLFWAFLYNVFAIPVAAFGFLSPMIGALSMAFSDVVVIGNSLRLKTKKIFS